MSGRLAATLVGAVLITACAGESIESASLSSAEAGAAATATAEPAPSAPSGRFVVDGERELFVRCMGSGSPVILMEAGGGDESTAWFGIMPALAEHTMVCAYDRAGTGMSDPAPEEPRAAAHIQRDLDALLEAAHIPPPYLLVGQSFGGAVTLYHAMLRPENVAGMVIVDSDWPSTDPQKDPMRVALTDEQWAEFMGDGEQWDDEHNTEHIDFPNLTKEIERSVHALPGVPIRILSANQVPPECPAEWDCKLMIEKSIEFHRQWLQLSPDAIQVLVDGGHNLHEDNPQAVTAEILTALEGSRP